MFKTRLLSGILLVIIALVTVITGGNLLFAVLLLISLIGMTELYKVFHIEKKAPGIVGYIFAILYYGLLYFKPLLPGESLNCFVMLFMAFLICQMAVLVFAYPKYNTQQIFAGFFGMFYVAVMLSYIYQTRNLPGGIFSVWLVFVCSWGCDTCAYCVGMLIGKHKLAPILSPKKSIEGGIGGILGAALIGVLYGLYTKSERIRNKSKSARCLTGNYFRVNCTRVDASYIRRRMAATSLRTMVLSGLKVPCLSEPVRMPAR